MIQKTSRTYTLNYDNHTPLCNLLWLIIVTSLTNYDDDVGYYMLYVIALIKNEAASYGP